MSSPAFIVTDSFATVVIDGRNYTVTAGHPEFKNARLAIKEGRYADVPAMVDRVASINKFGEGKVVVQGGVITYSGKPLNNTVTDIILSMQAEGFNIAPMVRFLENLMANPSKTSVDELYLFLEYGKMPITEDGCFLAYKRVRGNYFDIHSGTFDNSVGKVCEMPRNQVDDARERTCSAGLHFCSFDYLPHFSYSGTSDKIMIVKINPRDVVSIPADYKNTKGRTARYEVIGEHKSYHTTQDNVLSKTTVVSETNAEKNAAGINDVIVVKKPEVKKNSLGSIRLSTEISDAVIESFWERGKGIDEEDVYDFTDRYEDLDVSVSPKFETLVKTPYFAKMLLDDADLAAYTGTDLKMLFNQILSYINHVDIDLYGEYSQVNAYSNMATSKAVFISDYLRPLIADVFVALAVDIVEHLDSADIDFDIDPDSVQERVDEILELGVWQLAGRGLKRLAEMRNELVDAVIDAGYFTTSTAAAQGIRKIVKYSTSTYDAASNLRSFAEKVKTACKLK